MQDRRSFQVLTLDASELVNVLCLVEDAERQSRSVLGVFALVTEILCHLHNALVPYVCQVVLPFRTEFFLICIQQNPLPPGNLRNDHFSYLELLKYLFKYKGTCRKYVCTVCVHSRNLSPLLDGLGIDNFIYGVVQLFGCERKVIHSLL